MRAWSVFWILLTVVVATFVLVNWSVLTAQTRISLLVSEVTAPLGLTMLGALVGLALLFLVFLAWLQTTALRRIAKAKTASDELAGPMAELRSDLDRAVNGLRLDTNESMRTIMSRLEDIARAVRHETPHGATPPPRSTPPSGSTVESSSDDGSMPSPS